MSIRSFKRAHERRVARERRRLEAARRHGTRVAGVALSASALFAAGAQATTYTVTTAGAGAGSCTSGPTENCTTLRAAITAADADTTSADTINFGPGATGTISTGSADPFAITGTENLTINGPGPTVLTISGGGDSQIFTINSGSSNHPAVAISGLTLTDGSGGSSNDGGAIEDEADSIDASLTLNDDTITNSTTQDTGGGGGVYTAAPLTVTGSTISGDTAPDGRGGGVSFAENSPYSKYKGTFSGTTITGNTAESGGGITGGEDSLTNSQITGNNAITSGSSDGFGGGIYAADGSLTLTGSTVSGNTSTKSGGGIFSGTKYGTKLVNSTISGNTSVSGGGLSIYGEIAIPGRFAKYNPILIEDSTISQNHATDGAGVDLAVTGPGSPVKILASTISGNQGGTASFGGGLLVGGSNLENKYMKSNLYAPVDVVDSTVSGNTATDGGGVSISDGGTYPLIAKIDNGSLAFTDSTIAGNSASAAGGGIYLGEYSTGTPATEQSGIASLNGTIVAGNTAAGKAQDLARAATSTSGGFDGAFSLVQTPGTAPLLSSQSMILGANPELGPLGSNGGPTQTMLPSGSSPVIGQGRAESGLTTDQRGDPRTVVVAGIPTPPSGDGTDIGAVELPASSVVVPPAFSVSIGGKLLGGSAAPLLAGSSTPVKCTARVGTLGSCVIEVLSTRGKLLASGLATTSAASSLSTSVSLTAGGLAALARQPLGLTTDARVVAGTNAVGSQTVIGKVRLLAGPAITLPIGVRSTKLPAKLTGELDQVAHLLTGASTITCSAYSDRGQGDKALTRAQALAACKQLLKDGFKGKVKSVGEGHSDPIASNGSANGRAKNRRLVITFKL